MKLRLWTEPEGAESDVVSVASFTEAINLIREMDEAIAAGLEYWDDEAGEWFEWHDAEGRSINDIV